MVTVLSENDVREIILNIPLKKLSDLIMEREEVLDIDIFTNDQADEMFRRMKEEMEARREVEYVEQTS